MEGLIDSLTISENQKLFLREKAYSLYNGLKMISQNLIPYWSSLYLSKDTYQYTLKRFWFETSFDMGLFIKNRFDVDIYFIFGKNNTNPLEQNHLIGSILFELLYSHLKVYQFNYREYMKILKEPPYIHAIPIRMDYQGISILFNCIPAIELPNEYLIIPNGLGDTKKIIPKLEVQTHSKINRKQNGRMTKLILLIKYWNFNWGKPIKGHLIEHLVEFIFNKIEIHSWDRAVKTFFSRAIYFLDKKRLLHHGIYNQLSILEVYSSDELKKFLQVLREAEMYAQKGKWEELFSDL